MTDNCTFILSVDQDGAEPCANSVSVHNLLRLSSLLQVTDFKDKADNVLKVYYERLTKVPVALPEMVSAVFTTACTPKQVHIRHIYLYQCKYHNHSHSPSWQVKCPLI